MKELYECGIFHDRGLPSVHVCTLVLNEYHMRQGGPALENIIGEMYKTEH